MIAYGEPLPKVADALCRRIEAIAPEAICSVLSVDVSGRIHPVASPSLPVEYSSALDGLAIGPRGGSCGTAAYRGEAVMVEDIANDPLWEDYRALVLPLGLKSCWSSPIKARGGRVIGTFALYYRKARGPERIERLAVATCLHLCAIALEQAEIQARNHELAFYDPLTGLPNRLHADTLLRQRLEYAPDGLGLLLIDIDNLKVTNDTLGHAVGDELIRQVAQRVARTVRPGTACRIGGDEFVVILSGCTVEDALGVVARRVIASMEEPFVADGHTIVPHVTIGGALYGRDGTDIDTLRQNADLALYDSKETGRGRFIEYSPRLRKAMIERARRINEVEAALNEGRMLAYYQPVMRLDTREIVGLEALARLRRKDGDVIAAGHFEEALREPRVACRLTARMLEYVAADLRRWLEMGIPFQHVGVNVSMADFQITDLASRVAHAFGGPESLLRHLVLEVTETVLVGSHDGAVAHTVSNLRAMGVRIALDDFGTGFASLTHLLTFPADVIKIDKSFVARLTSDTAADVIVASLVDIAKKLGMRVVAEGIETEEQAARLGEVGCALGQGFLYFRPASFEETSERLKAHAQPATRAGGIASKRVA